MTHHLVGIAEIAEMLGVSRQRVDQLVEAYEDFPPPEAELSGGRVWSRTAIETWIHVHPERGPGRRAAETPESLGSASGGLFQRFTDRARRSIVKAQEEARMLRHNYIGTEHLLLGLLALDEGIAARALGELGVDLSHVRSRVAEMIGTGPELPTGHIPFTPRAKNCLEFSLSEALKLGHNYIGTEHVLLGLLDEPGGVAWQILEAKGLTVPAVRAKVLSTLEGFVAGQGEGQTAGPSCSFCGKRLGEVKVVVPVESFAICDECISRCVDILEGQRGADSAAGSNVLERLDRLEARVAKLEG